MWFEVAGRVEVEEIDAETDGKSNRPLRPMKTLHSVICKPFIWHSGPHFQEHMPTCADTTTARGWNTGEIKCWQVLLSYYIESPDKYKQLKKWKMSISFYCPAFLHVLVWYLFHMQTCRELNGYLHWKFIYVFVFLQVETLVSLDSGILWKNWEFHFSAIIVPKSSALYRLSWKNSDNV